MLLTGQLELIQLEDPKAAVETLSTGLRFAPVAARGFQELVVDAEKGCERKQGAPMDQLWSELMVPIVTQRYLAMAYERLGEQRLAADAWCRVRLSDMAHRTGLAWVDREHLVEVLNGIPEDTRTAHHTYVLQYPGTYRSRLEPSRINWKSVVPEPETSPFKAAMLDEEQFTALGPASASMARLSDGCYFLAFTSGDWQQHRIRFATSQDGENWDPSWEFSLNSIFDTRAPSVTVDDDGVIWMLFTSKRFDHQRYSNAGYRLWLTSSSDGRTWSRIQPVAAMPGQYQNTVQLTRDHTGRFWIFSQGYFGSGDSPAIVGPLQPIQVTVEQQSLGMNNLHAVFDHDNVCHLVFETFGQSIHYSSSTDMET
jgi:hypothetical protein